MNKFEKSAIARRAFRERGPMTILEAMHTTKISAECLRSVVCAPEYEMIKPRGGRAVGAVWALREQPPALTAMCDGGTVHRRDGSDPWLGVCVAEAG